ncbi:URC4/urg3 family protein [Segnochrobactraceae bacterium EtOH-i3]
MTTLAPADPAVLARSLLSARAVRARAHQMLALAEADAIPELTVDLARLEIAADETIATMCNAYPALQIPPHARWRHFSAGGIDRWPLLVRDAAALADPVEKARAAADLAIVSVLLDAGAGPDWAYADPASGTRIARSEGLAVASFDAFVAGLFSADPARPLQADAAALSGLKASRLAEAFQAGPANPLVGVEGRAGLIARLGDVVASRPDVFALTDTPRPGGIIDALMAVAENGRLPAERILETVLDALGSIWPSRLTLAGVPLGDCWRHPALVTGDASDGLVPFHKLSQWLSYSMLEPLGWAGLTVTDLDGLTGLPEYRNGGLFLDTGVIALRNPADATRPLTVDDPLVVAWRALTVALLDRVAELIRTKLSLTAEELPLAAVLEGGTWAAGRRLARRFRADGGPPLVIVSDGTVF